MVQVISHLIGTIFILKHGSFAIRPTTYQLNTVSGGFPELTRHCSSLVIVFPFLPLQLKRELANLPGQPLQTLPKWWTL